ncbi:hypothetical protein CPC08DRAFT_768736 [Agrocybe pediades]|nr:hypothetical protein CPC08DRAFT_768736 [Agrocybe pediades]
MFNTEQESSNSTECFNKDELWTYQCIGNVNDSFSNPYKTPVDTFMLDDTSIFSLQYGFIGLLPNIHPVESFDVAA